MKIDKIIELWKADKRLYVKKSTYSAYLLLIENHIRSYFSEKEEITEEDIQKFVLTELKNGLSQKTIKDIIDIVIINTSKKIRWNNDTYRKNYSTRFSSRFLSTLHV